MSGNAERASILFEIHDNISPGLSQIKANLSGVVAAAVAVKGTFMLVEQAARMVSESLRHVTEETRKAEDASTRLSIILRNTGSAADLTKAQIDAMADSLAESTQFDDESIRNAASEILKFGSIHGETFKEVLKLSADVAAFMGTDVVSAARDVAKAMADPETAAKLLKSAGVVLTAQQKDQLKAMGEVGDIAGQQAIVLERLKGAYAGMAEEINSGLTRSTTGATKAWDELLETIGKTRPVQMVVKTTLSATEQALKDIKAVIEDGDWVGKLLKILAFTGNRIKGALPLPLSMAGGLLGTMMPDSESERPGEVSGAIGRLPTPKPGETDAEYLARKKREADAAKEAAKIAAEREDMLYTQRVAAMKEAGATKAELDQAAQDREDRIYANAVAAAKELKAAQEETAKAATKLWDDTRTPMERTLASIKQASALLDEGAIDWDTYGRAVDKAMQGLNEKTKDRTDEMTEFWKQAAHSMQESMSGLFFDVIQGKLSDFGTSAKRTIDKMVANVLAAEAQTSLLGADFGKGGPIGGLVGKGLDLLGLGGGGYITGGAGAAAWTSGADLPLGGFASGGSFTVGGAGGVDSKLVSFMATPGEKVNVQTPAQQPANSAGRDITVNQAFHITGPVDSRSRSQIAAGALEGAQRALMRNG